MKTVFARSRKAMTVLGAVLLIWSAMQSDGGAPLALVAPTAGAAVALLLWGRLLTPKPVKKQEKTPAANAAGCFCCLMPFFSRPASGSTWA